jgi:hypothetical protein
MVETAVFLALIVPMPVSARQKLFRFLSENLVVAKIQYGLKVCSPPSACTSDMPRSPSYSS